MIDGYSAAQVRAAEAHHLAAGEPLMQRAAAGLADEIRTALRIRQDASGGVLLLVGSGNNGGDALFAGAALAGEGVRVSIAATGSRIHEAGLAAARDTGAVLEPTDPFDADRLARAAAGSSVVVDAILGTGTSEHPALRGMARDLVAAILPIVSAPGGPVVIAVDIPSGINPDDGSVPDPLVLPADVTVTFGACKAGLLLPPASDYAGRIRLIDIGLGADLHLVEPAVRGISPLDRAPHHS